MQALLLLVLAAAAPDFIAPFGEGTKLPDGEVFDSNWLARIGQGDYTLEPFGPPHANKKPQVVTDGATARWLDKTGAMWLHLEANAAKKLDGDVLHIPDRPKGHRCCYAAQFKAGRRQGWQVYVSNGAAVCTDFDKGRPIISHEIRGGKVLATWMHASIEKPNAGLQAKFVSAEREHDLLFKEVLPSRRKLVAQWERDARNLARKALGPIKRDAINNRENQRRAESTKAHAADALRHKRMEGGR